MMSAMRDDEIDDGEDGCVAVGVGVERGKEGGGG
jgi:hypothetical protein